VVLLWLHIVPHTAKDQERLGVGLQHLMADDRTLAVKSSADDAVMIGAPSEEQLEQAVSQLVRRFGVQAAVKSLEIAYKETLTRTAQDESTYVKQSGGRGHYAHVKLCVEPREPGSGCVFENAIVGGAIPDRMITSIEGGVDEVIDRGILAGYPMDVQLAGGEGRTSHGCRPRLEAIDEIANPHRPV